MKKLTDKTTYTCLEYQRGLSLIELMISITIGLLLLVSLSTLFINQSKTRTELDKSNRMIDNGRYAMDLLSSNLRLAGFYDSYVPRGAPMILNAVAVALPDPRPDPCDLTIVTDPAKNLDILRLHVQGINATTATTPSFSVWPLCAAAVTASGSVLNPGSDILVIRRASTATVSSAVTGDDTTYLQVSSCPTDTVNYLIATTLPSAFTLLKKDCATAATKASLRAFLVQVYFVSKDNIPGDGIPTLKRIEQDPSGATSNFVVTPLVEGVEFMQFDYGVDDTPGPPAPSGDGVADRYIDCSTCNLTDWSNVVSVKINLLARNQQTTMDWNDKKTYNLGIDGTVGPKGDTYKRHAYTQLVRLDNPAGRRETPCTAPCR